MQRKMGYNVSNKYDLNINWITPNKGPCHHVGQILKKLPFQINKKPCAITEKSQKDVSKSLKNVSVMGKRKGFQNQNI